MDAQTFDAFARQFSHIRATRRATAGALVAGLTSVAFGRAVAAQDATPSPEDGHQEFLFVQLAEQGSWLPSPNEEDVFLLTLTGATSQIVFFSDRPQRIVGSAPASQVFAALGFTPGNAPNAAIVAQDENGERDVLVVELFDPILSQEFGSEQAVTIVYKARVLDESAGNNLDEWQLSQQDDRLTHDFTNVSLFIDDCPDLVWCNGYHRNDDNDTRSMGAVPNGPIGTCWDPNYWECNPCDGNDSLYYDELCNRTYPDCNVTCQAGPNYYP